MIVGMMRVKDEARWIERSIQSILPICDKVLVMNDHSTDATARLAAVQERTSVFDSPFTGLDEARDKNWLLDIAVANGADWVLCIDGDEMLAPASVPILKQAMQGGARCISMRIPYLWDQEDQIRVDGVYGEFRRHSAFRPRGVYVSNQSGGFHCGNTPFNLTGNALTLDSIQLMHFGYMHTDDRARKYCWYNAMDPNNAREDRYRHIAAGLAVPYGELIARQIALRMAAGLPSLKPNELLPPAPAAWDITAHAGPLELRRL